MSDSTLTKPKRKSSAGYEAISAQLFAEIVRLEAQMDRDRRESEQLKAETQVIKMHSAATLAELQEQMKRLAKAV